MKKTKLTQEQFIDNCRKTHGNKYDYSLVRYTGCFNKINIICKEHGTFTQVSSTHLKGSGCPTCGRERTKTKQSAGIDNFIIKAKKIHGDKYDYSFIKYINKNTKVKIICSQHGVFEQTPDSHINGKSGCPICYGNYKPKTQEYINKVKKLHNCKFDYSLTSYINKYSKIEVICPNHGVFKITASHHAKGIGCSKCSKTHHYTNEEFIEKAIKAHNNEFNYSLCNYINANTKVKIVCPKHGIFEQVASVHLNGRGCPICTNEKRHLTTDDFTNKSIEIHGNKYDYSKVKYEKNREKVIITCKKHGDFTQTPHSHLKGQGCPICKESKGEKEIADFLLKHNIKAIREHKFTNCKNINPLPFDFYLPDLNICIEFNGEQHYKPMEYFGGVKSFKLQKEKDNIKKEYCINKNINLITIKFNENISEKLIHHLTIA